MLTGLLVAVHEDLRVVLLYKVLPDKLKAVQFFWGGIFRLHIRLCLEAHVRTRCMGPVSRLHS